MEGRERINKIKEFHRRFANGEQNIVLGADGVIEAPKTFYWQANNCYNNVGRYVEMLKRSYHLTSTSKELFGENGMVAQMVPIQKAYNDVTNRMVEITNQLAMPVLACEDGSVDLDSLEEEGLAPGKVLVYRQGANKPDTIKSVCTKEAFDFMLTEQERLLSDMYHVYEMFEQKLLSRGE